MGDERDRQPRVKEPNRKQGEIRFEIPEDTLPSMHPARVLWNVVETLDLSKFLKDAKAVGGRSGRDTLSPAMKLTLWLYAISQGIGSSREIERLVGTDDAFRWVVGDLHVGHHTLSGFRAGHGEALDALMTDILASACSRWSWSPRTGCACARRRPRRPSAC